MLRFLPLILLALLVFSATPSSSTATHAAASAPRYQVALPLLSAPPAVQISFGTDMRADSDLLTGVAASFAYGLDLLYVQAEMQGVADQSFQLDLVFPDGQRIKGSAYAPYTADFLETRAYCFAFFGCAGERAALPEGVYTAELYLNGRLWQTASATIR